MSDIYRYTIKPKAWGGGADFGPLFFFKKPCQSVAKVQLSLLIIVQCFKKHTTYINFFNDTAVLTYQKYNVKI